jgi:hypothetical protein
MSRARAAAVLVFWSFCRCAALRCAASWEASQAVGNSQRASMSSVNANVNANASVKVRDNVDEARPLLVNARLCCSTWVAAGREKRKDRIPCYRSMPSFFCLCFPPPSVAHSGGEPFLSLFFSVVPFFAFFVLLFFLSKECRLSFLCPCQSVGLHRF